jgi:hypothetical protein
VAESVKRDVGAAIFWERRCRVVRHRYNRAVAIPHRNRTTVAGCLMLWLVGAGLVLGDEAGAPPAPAQRQDLVGAWRLLRIEILSGGAAHSDPFYGAHCSGLLIYAASGSMSVQISGLRRPRLPTPSARGPKIPRDVEAGAQALATYYAYFGTWDYDADARRVTHHVAGSLYPEEAGLSYTQEVTLDGDRMTFTVRAPNAAGGESLHRKVWERVRAGPAGAPEEQADQAGRLNPTSSPQRPP